MKTASLEQETRVLRQLCLQLRWIEERQVWIECRPDRIIRTREACDAIIRRGDSCWAVEHRRLYDRPGAPGLKKRVQTQVVPIIQEAVSSSFTRGLYCVAVPWSEFRGRVDCAAKARAMGVAAVDGLRRLADQRPGRWLAIDVDGFEARALVMVMLAGGQGDCLVCGVTPDDTEQGTADEMREALEHKAPAMRQHKKAGIATMLVLEREDYLHHNDVRAPFAAAVELGGGRAYDEIYVAASGYEVIWFEPLRLMGAPVTDETLERWHKIWVRATRLYKLAPVRMRAAWLRTDPTVAGR